jgi:hypothetical protein
MVDIRIPVGQQVNHSPTKVYSPNVGVPSFSYSDFPGAASFGAGFLSIEGNLFYSNGYNISPINTKPLTNRQWRVGIVGDSFAVRDTPANGPNWYGYRDTTSLFFNTNIMLGHRLNLVYVDGIAGTTYPQWDNGTRIEAALAQGLDYLWLTGDGDGGDTTSTGAAHIAALTSIFTKCLKKGVTPIMHTIPPSTAFATAAVRLRVQQVNSWLKYTAPTLFPVIIIPVEGASLASGSNTYQADTNLTDGTHYQYPGAFNAAQIAFKVLDPLIPRWNIPWLTSYDSASGGLTQVLQSPIMNGTGGGASVLTTTTGVPPGITVGITAGESGTVNRSARTDLEPGGWLDYACTFTAADKTATLQFNGAGTGLAGKSIGDYVQFFCEFKFDTSTIARVKFPYFYVEFIGAGTKYASAFDVGSVPAQPLANANWSNRTSNDIFIFATPRLQIPTGTTNFYFNAGVRSAAAGTCNFSIGRIAIV